MDLVTPGPELLLWTLIPLLFAVLWLIALIDLSKSRFAENGKIFWLLIVLLLPFVGTILYFFIGRKQKLKPN